MVTTRISVWLLLIGIGLVCLSASAFGQDDLDIEDHEVHLAKREPRRKDDSDEDGGRMFGFEELKKGFEKVFLPNLNKKKSSKGKKGSSKKHKPAKSNDEEEEKESEEDGDDSKDKAQSDEDEE